MKNSFRLLIISVLLSACGKIVVEPTSTTTAVVANANLANYIAVGGSWAAGYTNGGFYRAAQINSYPNLLAQQLKIVGGGAFSQALLSNDEENGLGYLTGTSLIQTSKVSTNTLKNATFAKFIGNTNDYSTAGLRMSDVLKVGLGNTKNSFVNLYFERLLTKEQPDKAYLEVISTAKPTFFTVTLGEEDVKAFATSGGTDVLTDALVFSNNIQKLLDALIANGAKGVISNVPDIQNFPYFTYYTYDQFRAANGNADIYIMAGNGIVRKAVSTDLFLVNGGNTFGQVNSKGEKKGLSANFPMANNEVLDGTEIANVIFKINETNQIIKKEADARNIPIVDLNSVFKQIKAGTYAANGVTKLDYNVSSTGIFSLDGVNPNTKGYAVIANEFIKAINTSYKSLVKTDVPILDVSKY